MSNELQKNVQRKFLLANFKTLNLEVTKENHENRCKNEGKKELLCLQFI